MDKIRILLSQHIGPPCKAIVETGEEVKRGQLIAVPTGLGANIHSSQSGKIVEINEREIIIECEENQSEEFLPIKETEDHLEAIKEAGIVGAGGAGFPAHVKFNIDLDGGYFIANATECEPILNHNISLLQEDPGLIIRGMKYIMKIINAEIGYIGIKAKNEKAIRAINDQLRPEDKIEVKILTDMYPAGDERVIIRELIGVELEPGQLPSVVKSVVSNVETIKNVTNAIEKRKPVIDKDLTIGGRVRESREGRVYFNIPIGTPLKKIIDQSGGYVEPHGEIVIGGPFTGKHGEESTPVTKTLGGIIVAMPFPEDSRKVGILACECGAEEERLKEIAQGMGAELVAELKCKRMVEVDGRWRCEKPGICPGQAESVLKLKKAGAEIVLIGSCDD